MSMMDNIVTLKLLRCFTFQDGTDMELTDRRTNWPTTSFLDFSRVKHAQAAHEQNTQQLN